MEYVDLVYLATQIATIVVTVGAFLAFVIERKRERSKMPPDSFFRGVAKEIGHDKPFAVEKVNGEWIAIPKGEELSDETT